MSLKELKAKLEKADKVKEFQKESLTNILDTQINEVKSFSKSKYQLKPAFKPSALGSPCLRKVYYDYFRVEPDYEFPLEAKKILLVGDTIHEMLSGLFRRAGILIDYRNKSNGEIPKSRHTGLPDPEFPLKCPDLEISAKVDAVIIRDGKLCIAEFKSSNTNKFDKLKAPEEAHAMQVSIYHHIFSKQLAAGEFDHIIDSKKYPKVDEVRVLYLNKNNSQLKEFLVENPEEEFAKVLAKMGSVKDFIAKEELPPKTWDFCKGCAWRDKCQSEFKVEKNKD